MENEKLEVKLQAMHNTLCIVCEKLNLTVNDVKFEHIHLGYTYSVIMYIPTKCGTEVIVTYEYKQETKKYYICIDDSNDYAYMDIVTTETYIYNLMRFAVVEMVRALMLI